MTKVIVLGDPEWKPTGTKPIEFVSLLVSMTYLDTPLSGPKDWNSLTLVGKHKDGLDIMIVSRLGNPREKAVHLGYFNDGVVGE
ncbi:MAG: hypothetical protein EOP56_09245 [Sphingobacteriales bacterium]|nr:MAG: hypothetical protein EOP56_09245 [Sphingobacteriales bacterium]